MGTGRPILPLTLSSAERQTLEPLVRRRKTAPQLARRARIVLLAATGPRHPRVANRLGVCIQTVGKWRKRFLAERLDGL